jgi:hypothetical protein
MGRPRRFSAAFARQERAKLERFRMDVRSIQQGRLVNSELVPFPDELPPRLAEGQPVLAIHPETREPARGERQRRRRRRRRAQR